MLGEEFDVLSDDGGDVAGAGKRPVQVGPTTTGRTDHTLYDRFVRAVDQSGFDRSFLGARLDERGRRLRPHQQADRTNNQRLARTRLAGDRRQAAFESDVSLPDYSEVPNAEFV